MKRPPLDEDTFLRFFRTLDERQARLCAAERALAIGRGGITLVSRVTGLSWPTIHKGITELRNTGATLTTGRIRRSGGGRKKVEVVDPAVLPILQQVVESSTAGSPMDVLRWTSKSKTKLAEALAERGHRLAPNTVGRLLRDVGALGSAARHLRGFVGRAREAGLAVVLATRPERLGGSRPSAPVPGPARHSLAAGVSPG